MKTMVVTAIINGKTVVKETSNIVELKQLLNSIDDFDSDRKIVDIDVK